MAKLHEKKIYKERKNERLTTRNFFGEQKSWGATVRAVRFFPFLQV